MFQNMAQKRKQTESTFKGINILTKYTQFIINITEGDAFIWLQISSYHISNCKQMHCTFYQWMHHLRLAGKGQSKDGKITQKILWPPVIQIMDPRSFCYSWQCIKKYLFCKERKDKNEHAKLKSVHEKHDFKKKIAPPNTLMSHSKLFPWPHGNFSIISKCFF